MQQTAYGSLVAVFLLAMVAIVAWFLATREIVAIAEAKGYGKGGTLWFVSLCLTFFAAAMIVIALPDRSAAPGAALPPRQAGGPDELPSV